VCFYEDSMHICFNICVCVYVCVIGGDVYMFICVCQSMYVCVHVCMCVRVCMLNFVWKQNVKCSDSDNCTFSSVSASAELLTDSLRNENDMEAVSEVDNNLSRDTVLQIDTVN